MSDRPVRPMRAGALAPARMLWLLPAACCLFATGCNSGKQMQRDLYARELRLQEDEIYRLEDYIEEYQAIIRGLRQENSALKELQYSDADASGAGKKGGSGSVGDDDPAEERSLLDSPDWSPDRPSKRPTPPPPRPLEEEPDVLVPPVDDPAEAPPIELPAIDAGEPAEAPKFEPAPEIELPQAPDGGATSAPVSPSVELLPEPVAPPPADKAAGFGAALLGDAPVDHGAVVAAAAVEPRAAAQRVESAQARLVGTENPGAAPIVDQAAVEDWPAVTEVVLFGEPGPVEPTGESTLMVQSQPLAEDGGATLFSGSASLLLRDPRLRGAEADLARWDYSVEEVSAAWRDLQDAPRLEFALVLPEDAPTNRPLELWIRLVDADAVKVLGNAAVTLGAPLPLAAPEDAAPILPTALLAPPPGSTTEGAEHGGSGWAPRSQTAPGGLRSAAAASWREAADGVSSRGSEVRIATFEEASAADGSASEK